jgi:hypothetical protein
VGKRAQKNASQKVNHLPAHPTEAKFRQSVGAIQFRAERVEVYLIPASL